MLTCFYAIAFRNISFRRGAFHETVYPFSDQRNLFQKRFRGFARKEVFSRVNFNALRVRFRSVAGQSR